MNKINFQPTGIYPQIAKNPNIINVSANQTEEKPVWENKGYKIKKTAAEILVLGVVISTVAFMKYYNKGMKAIKLKDTIVPEIPKDKTFADFLKEGAFTYEEQEFITNAYNKGLKFEQNIVGKVNRGIKSVSNFFKENFYGYKTPKK